MATALVTGGTGFVGRALCARLTAGGFTVRASTRTAAESLAPPGVKLLATGELGPETRWEEALSGVDVVFHLAARVHMMKETAADPEAEYRRVNVAATEHLARRAVAAGVHRFVFVSTTKVLGEGRPAPYTDGDPAAPEDAYGRSKWGAEKALEIVSEGTGLRVVVVRPPLVYGAGVKANFLRLFRAVERGLPLPLGAITGNQRSLIYLENLADALHACAVAPLSANRTFLVSDGEDVSTAELARRMARALGRPARLLPVPPSLLRAGAWLFGRSAAAERLVGSLAVDSRGIREVLGWNPPFDLDTGLARTAAWHRRGRGESPP